MWRKAGAASPMSAEDTSSVNQEQKMKKSIDGARNLEESIC
jgi:hypothetical protein